VKDIFGIGFRGKSDFGFHGENIFCAKCSMFVPLILIFRPPCARGDMQSRYAKVNEVGRQNSTALEE